MKRLLNTLFVMTEDAYLRLEGETVVVEQNSTKIAQIPLHTLEAVYSFSYRGASPFLIGACVKKEIDFCFFSPNGRFLARAGGLENGNVLLRRQQYRIADDPELALPYSRNFILGKLYNSRWVLERCTRDHPDRIDVARFKKVSAQISSNLADVRATKDLGTLRGIEGTAAQDYFRLFDEMILRQKEDFSFRGRNRRPPLDYVNAMLSFAYVLLANECASALRAAGLDPFVGFMHQMRPGRNSLALDLEEELRPVFADRFVLTSINQRSIQRSDFDIQENGAVLLNESGRRSFLKLWEDRRKEQIRHPFLDEKIEWGLVPYVQALLLARTIRGDLEEYPPFFWK